VGTIGCCWSNHRRSRHRADRDHCPAAITVTGIANFGWLEHNINTLWPSWEYEATDVSKLKIGAKHFEAAHKPDVSKP